MICVIVTENMLVEYFRLFTMFNDTCMWLYYILFFLGCLVFITFCIEAITVIAAQETNNMLFKYTWLILTLILTTVVVASYSAICQSVSNKVNQYYYQLDIKLKLLFSSLKK